MPKHKSKKVAARDHLLLECELRDNVRRVYTDDRSKRFPSYAALRTELEPQRGSPAEALGMLEGRIEEPPPDLEAMERFIKVYMKKFYGHKHAPIQDDLQSASAKEPEPEPEPEPEREPEPEPDNVPTVSELCSELRESQDQLDDETPMGICNENRQSVHACGWEHRDGDSQLDAFRDLEIYSASDAATDYE